MGLLPAVDKGMQDIISKLTKLNVMSISHYQIYKIAKAAILENARRDARDVAKPYTAPIEAEHDAIKEYANIQRAELAANTAVSTKLGIAKSSIKQEEMELISNHHLPPLTNINNQNKGRSGRGK